jgi:hypothetical protein
MTTMMKDMIIESNTMDGPQVINGIDDPSVISMTTVGVYDEKVDEIVKEPDVVPVVPEKPANPVPVEPPVSPKEEDPSKDPEKPPVEPVKPIVKSADDIRFSAITKARRIAERQRDELVEQVKKLVEENATLKKTIPLKDKPKVEDFEDDAAFHEALSDWTYDKKRKAEMDMEAARVEVKSTDAAFDELDAEIDTAMETGRAKYPDFNDTVLGDKSLHLTPVMIESALLSDSAADILYFIGKNPERAEEISKMPPLKVAREITKIEKELTTSPPAEPPKVPAILPEPPPTPPIVPEKKVPQAPPPITPPIMQGHADKDPADMSPREYRKWREEGRST